MSYNIIQRTETQNGLFLDMLHQNHLLIGGATGSGKSVLENNLIYTALQDAKNRFIFIDPKKVELYRYKDLPQCILYADEERSIINALQYAVDIMMKRYDIMRSENLLKYEGEPIYIFIDEAADLMTTSKKEVKPLLQRLMQLARAASIHVILCTQKPTNQVLPTEITVNIVGRVALATRNARESQNIINFSGAELINKKGIGLYTNESNRQPLTVSIPMITQETIQELITYYESQKPKKSLFVRLFGR